MKRWRFQFSLLGLLGLMTCVAIILAAAQHELGLVALAGVYITFIVFISTLFLIVLLRDCWMAMRQRSWEPFRILSTKGGAIALGLLLTISVGGLCWSFGGPSYGGLEELVGEQWIGKCRAGASAVGVGAALLHVRHRSFWARNNAAKREGTAGENRDIVIAVDGDE